MKAFTYAVARYIRDHPGCTSIQVARALKPDDSKIYGYQRQTSRAIAALRQHGIVQDVGLRCDTCHRALTRHVPNVPLFLTKDGITLMRPGREPFLGGEAW